MKNVGDRSVWGVQFAVDEINAAGGLLGKKVKLMPEDSQLKPDVAARKATKAIMQDEAQFIFQLTSTAVAQALMDVAEKNKVIYVNLGPSRISSRGKISISIPSALALPPTTALALTRNFSRPNPGENSIS